MDTVNPASIAHLEPETGKQSLSADEKLARLGRQLERYQNAIGYLPVKTNNKADLYLNMQQEQMRTLQADECFEAGIILSQYAAFLQEAHNKEVARSTWADNEIKRTITKQMSQYKSASADERKYMAIIHDDAGRRLDELRAMSQAVADRLSFMANRADSIARAYIGLAQHRRK